ncbi:probable low affinity copper uptake protein 2 isoform X1 [Cimex lectularius]|uniref:Copper transport protein n=1 Tax=Cimex lectularius TaxID=79782 RepID=A0A8I6RMU8_CIMLE|nr:probable low affinity copper uptake protein 2 isoform X1 [Cimex lectularius]
MENTFWFGYKFEKLFFPFVNIETYGEFILACAGIIILTLIFEILKIFEVKTKLNNIISLQKLSENSNDTNQLLGQISFQSDIRKRLLCLETGIYVIELTVGYMIMMIVMTYNVYFFFIVIGVTSLVYFFMGQYIMNFKLQLTKLTKADDAGLCMEPDDATSVDDSTCAVSMQKPHTVHQQKNQT